MQNERAQVMGFGRRLSGKAIWVEKKVYNLRKNNSRAILGIEEKFANKTKQYSATDDLKAVNPNYRNGTEWMNNCQRCVPTYEMRLRGKNVTALPNKHYIGDPIADNPSIVWKDVEILKYTGIHDINKQILQWGNNARAQIVISMQRDGITYGHTFMAINENGKIRFIDPQTSDINCEEYFDDLVGSKGNEFWRIDNAEPSVLINKCCKNVED